MRLTEEAVSEIKKVLDVHYAGTMRTYIRVGIVAHNCSGPVYSFSIEEEFSDEKDVLTEQDGLNLVNSKSLTEALQPIVIDFISENGKNGFKFLNPLALADEGCSSGGCCGGGSCSKG